MKLFHVGERDAPLLELLLRNLQWTQADRSEDCDVLLFNGGTAIYPAAYGEPVKVAKKYDIERDQQELALFNGHLFTPKIGICRGAHLLHVAQGGTLWQRIQGHDLEGEHSLLSREADGKLTRTRVTSTHTQAMRLSNRGWKHIAWHQYPEVLWYGYTNSLCYQPHPARGSQSTDDHFLKLVRRFICGS